MWQVLLTKTLIWSNAHHTSIPQSLESSILHTFNSWSSVHPMSCCWYDFGYIDNQLSIMCKTEGSIAQQRTKFFKATCLPNRLYHIFQLSARLQSVQRRRDDESRRWPGIVTLSHFPRMIARSKEEEVRFTHRCLWWHISIYVCAYDDPHLKTLLSH